MKVLIPQLRNISIITIILFFSTLLKREAGGGVFAQQLSFSSQYYTNQFVTNPALTGNKPTINGFITHRSQWNSVPGAPQTSYGTIDGPLDSKNLGLGLKFFKYTTDLLSRAGAFGTYSYKIKVNEDNTLVLGLALGVLDNKIDFTKAAVHDINDPILFQQQNKTVFSADFGLAYNWKKLELGFAVPQVLANKVKYGNLQGEETYYNLSRHFQGSIKYTVEVSKQKNITAYPLIMFRSVSGAPLQFDVNAVVDWKKSGWVGITFHSSNALAISAGLRYKNLSIGYAYDIGISKIKAYTGSSTEVLLGYTFNKRDPLVIDTTRGDIWAEQIQSAALMTKPLDYQDDYWKSLNKNVDQQKIFNTIVDAVINGKVQAYDLLTDSPLTVSQVQAILNKSNTGKSKIPKKVTEKDLSKIRMSERWVFDKGRFTLTKQVFRMDLLIKRLDDSGQYTGDDRPLFYVKLKN
ncbi:MAG: PorP/SprF family type IX secretion system membrane protein [Bacteroidota bacterium]